MHEGIIPPRVKYWERWLSPDLLARRYKHCLFSIVVKHWVSGTVGRNLATVIPKLPWWARWGIAAVNLGFCLFIKVI